MGVAVEGVMGVAVEGRGGSNRKAQCCRARKRGCGSRRGAESACGVCVRAGEGDGGRGAPEVAQGLCVLGAIPNPLRFQTPIVFKPP
eukprot:358702-Rhodomonas_salina.1